MATVRRILLITATLAIVVPTSVWAQALRSAGDVRGHSTAYNNQIPVWVDSEFARYVELGGAIGAVAGLVYGLAFERGSHRIFPIIGDSVIGFTAGIAGGAAVYLAKLAFRRQ